MTTLNPSPAQLRDALLARGVKLRLYKGWDTLDTPDKAGAGRPWAGPDGSDGLLGCIVHHTSTASATGSTGAPSLEWLVTAYNKPAANALVSREGDFWLCAAGSCWHSGNGGPWPAIGVDQAGMHGHFRLFGIEIDDPGVGKTITAAQIDTVGRVLAALRDLTGWGPERICTHGDWTDAGRWLTDSAGNPSPPGPYEGRKNDTLRAFYPAEFWRLQAATHAVPVPPIPTAPQEPDMFMYLRNGHAVMVTGGRQIQLDPATANFWALSKAPVVLYNRTPTAAFVAALDKTFGPVVA